MTNQFLITLGIFLIAISGMAIGVIISNRRIKGSCGGLASMSDEKGNPICQMCSHPSPDCTGDPAVEDCPPEAFASSQSSAESHA